MRHTRGKVGRVLISQAELSNRISSLGDEINSDYGDRHYVIVALLNGAFMFLADLIRHLDGPVSVDFLGVSSYRDSTVSGELVMTKELSQGVAGKDVLLVDDILDTGQTITWATERIGASGANSIKVCVLLDKPSRRVRPIEADYVGFRVEDLFVVGFGLDFDCLYRNLPFLAELQKET